MNKVTFQGDNVLVNGEVVAEMSGRGEVYIRMKAADGNFVVVSRFKYMRPKAGAKHWLKFILARMSAADIVARLTNNETGSRVSPLGLAQELGGYKSLNELHVEKQKAKMAADNARWAHDMATDRLSKPGFFNHV